MDLLAGRNPNFDDSADDPPDPAPWVDFASDNFALINEQEFLSKAEITAHSGKNAVWLGGVGNSFTFDDGDKGEAYLLEQDVMIPAGTSAVTLSCYYQTQTSETSLTAPTATDIMVAWLWDSGLDDTAYEFQRWYPENTAPGWHLFSHTASGANAASLAGNTYALQFLAQVDTQRATYFFIDTCSLKVTVCN